MLLTCSNGTGLGHLTRAAAIARRLRDRGAVPVLVVLSPVTDELAAEGFVVEHIPSYTHSPLPRGRWHQVLADQLGVLARSYRADLVTFDGVAPYRGVRWAMAADGAPPYVWVRRGRWRPGADAPQPTGRFAAVLEPGEVDGDVTTGRPRPGVHALDPVVWHDHGDLLPREQACAALGLDPDQRHVLVSLGQGETGPLTAARDRVTASLTGAGLVPVVARSPLVADDVEAPDRARVVRRFPLAPLLAAFEAQVLAAGYNSVVEVVACRRPAVLVANPATGVDDQRARAIGAARAGLALHWDPAVTPDPTAILSRLVSQEGQASLLTALQQRRVPAGADQAADLLLRLISRRGTVGGSA